MLALALMSLVFLLVISLVSLVGTDLSLAELRKQKALSQANARKGSGEAWKKQDSQIPKCVWYHTDAIFVCFRVVPPREIPTIDEVEKIWPSEEDIKAIHQR